MNPSKSKLLIHFLRMDLYRAFFSVQFFASILGVAIVLLVATFEGISLDTDVLYIFAIVFYGLPSMMIMIFCALPYAICFCEDYENKYLRVQLIRGNLHSYVGAKVITIFISSVLTMVFGIVLYVSILHCFLPWVTIGESAYENVLLGGGLRYVFKSGNYILYYVLFGMQFGLIAGVLSLLASYASLFLSNKLLILSIPLMGFYFIDFFLSRILSGKIPTLHMIFCASNNIWRNDIISFFVAIVIGLLGAYILYILIYKRLKVRTQNE